MDFIQLKHFLELSEILNYNQASSRCHVSPSTLSRSIQRLEESVGKTLFERDRRHVKITPAGERFRRYALDTLAAWSDCQSDLDQQGEALRGELSLYCSVTACYTLLPQIIPPFRQNYPEVNIKLKTGDANQAITKIKEGSVDVSIAPLTQKGTGNIITHPVTKSKLILIIPASACDVRDQALAKRPDWANIPFILPESGIIRTIVLKWFKQKEIKPKVYSEVSGHEAILALVNLGLGVGVIPELVHQESFLPAKPQELPVKPGFPDFTVSLCTRKDHLNRNVVRAFWESVR